MVLFICLFNILVMYCVKLCIIICCGCMSKILFLMWVFNKDKGSIVDLFVSGGVLIIIFWLIMVCRRGLIKENVGKWDKGCNIFIV